MVITLVHALGAIRAHKTYHGTKSAMKDMFPFLRKIRKQYNGTHVSADLYLEQQGEWTLLDHAYITEHGEERTWADDEADFKPIISTYETTIQN